MLPLHRAVRQYSDVRLNRGFYNSSSFGAHAQPVALLVLRDSCRRLIHCNARHLADRTRPRTVKVTRPAAVGVVCHGLETTTTPRPKAANQKGDVVVRNLTHGGPMLQAVLTIIVVVGAVALAVIAADATMTAIATSVIATLVVDALRSSRTE